MKAMAAFVLCARVDHNNYFLDCCYYCVTVLVFSSWRGVRCHSITMPSYVLFQSKGILLDPDVLAQILWCAKKNVPIVPVALKDISEMQMDYE